MVLDITSTSTFITEVSTFSISSLKKILELTYDKESYYDNTHNRIDAIEASIVIKSWLEK